MAEPDTVRDLTGKRLDEADQYRRNPLRFPQGRTSTAPAPHKSGAIPRLLDLYSTNQCSQRPRKHADGKSLWKKNEQGLFEFPVKVVSATYNSTNHRWEYTLKDKDNQPIGGTTKETDLA